VGALGVDADGVVNLAAGRLMDLLTVVEQRLSEADHAALDGVIKRHFPRRGARAHLNAGLPSLARVFTVSDAGSPAPVRTAALAALGEGT